MLSELLGARITDMHRQVKDCFLFNAHQISNWPVFDKPVVLGAISAISYSQDTMVQLGLGAEKRVVHTTLVQLQQRKTSMKLRLGGGWVLYSCTKWLWNPTPTKHWCVRTTIQLLAWNSAQGQTYIQLGMAVKLHPVGVYTPQLQECQTWSGNLQKQRTVYETPPKGRG